MIFTLNKCKKYVYVVVRDKCKHEGKEWSPSCAFGNKN
ncbi:hypothetical protein bthur0012_54580 [Bacillus thuringiensis serovar pulsiensis BGSC 4CC1]|nr:hypothetical protein bthur0012_54580 [Bacillus thuringiensis serovar pulsiensis BGSC 4CC1]